MPGVREQLLADLDAIDDAANEWRRVYTLPLVDVVVPGEPRPVDVAVVEAGGVAFDRLRDLFEIQRVDLTEARMMRLLHSTTPVSQEIACSRR